MLRNLTKNSIDRKIKKINEFLSQKNGALNVYQLFHNGTSEKNARREISKIYIEGIDLGKALCELKKINPFSQPNVERREKFFLDFRGNRDWENAPITKETLIQRNLFINKNYYEDSLGLLLGYEVVIPKKNRHTPIDLIGVLLNKNTLTINLIELKACALPANKTAESKELLLRAIFEISTYNVWFNSAWGEQGGAIKKALCREIKNVDDIKDIKIQNILLVPEIIANDIEFLDKNLLQDIQVYTIQANSNLTEKTKTSEKGKYFNIKKY